MTQESPVQPPASRIGWRRFVPTDIRQIRWLVQIAFIAGLAILLAILINNGRLGLQRAGLTPSFNFLNTPSNVQINEGLWTNPHVREDTYAHAFYIGLINTLRVIVIGLLLATLLGLVAGVARLSANWLIRTIATWYIEIMQNTPLLVQLVFLYAVFLTLPPVREAIILPGPAYLSVRGLAMPGLFPGAATDEWTLVVAVATMVAAVIYRRQRKIQLDTGRRTFAAEIAAAIVIAAVVIGWLALQPYTVSLPERVPPERLLRYNADKGIVLSPEFTAIIFGLVLYTGAFIAEVIRSGIQSIPNGQWEAARSQGFSYFQTLRLVILPQALRVAIPPLTNQYLNLIKNSSLAGVVGYADVFGVGKTGFESGQTIPVVIIVVTIYLTLDLITAFAMNILNSRVQFKTR